MSRRVLHRLVIRRANAAEIFLIRGAEGWQLPEVELEERHTAEVEHVNAEIRRRWGLDTVALFGLGHEESPGGVRRTHALVAASAGADTPTSTWSTSAAMRARSMSREDIDLAERALSSATAAMPWSSTAWWPAARAWIARQIGPTEIAQTRCWESSFVARAHTGRERFFFKAVPPSTREAAVTAFLAEREAPGAPDVVAVEHEQHWILMRAFEGSCLDDSRDPELWRRAIATYGALQAATIDAVDDFRKLGCPSRRLDDLAASIEPLLADRAALRIGEADGLTRSEAEAILAGAAGWRRGCEDLARSAMPKALDHGDLWPSNLLVGDRQCVIIDWEDAALAPAFLGIAPFLVMRAEWKVPLALDDIAASYLAPFAQHLEPGEARRLFDRAMPLGFLELAVRYWRMPAEVVALHPWMREMVPFFLRGVLGAVG